MERPGSQWGAAKGKGFCGLRPRPWWHQTFRPVLAVKLMGIIMLRNRCWPINFHTIIVEDVDGWCWKRSPTLGAHTHAHSCPWVLGGHGCNVIVHEWASVLCIPASSSKSESNFSDVGNTLTKKHSGLKLVTVNDLLFVQSNQDLV